MPFAGFKDWEDCIKTLMEEGYSKSAAQKICGALKARFEGEKNKSSNTQKPSFRQNSKNSLRFSSNGKIETNKFAESERIFSVRAIITTEGVMNGGFKSKEELAKSAWLFGNCPITFDHPPYSEVTSLQEIIGFANDISFNSETGDVSATLNIFKIPDTEDIIEKIKTGEIKEVSIGYWTTDIPKKGKYYNKRLNKEQEYDRLETDIVPNHIAILPPDVPAACSPEMGCKIETNTGGDSVSEGEKKIEENGAVAVHHTPIVDEPWDKNRAIRELRDWAGGDDKEKINWEKYRQGFAWFDSKNPDNFGSYKLPHHYVQGEKLVASRRGIMAAAAAIMGARGGVQIPARHIDGVKRHIAAHYHDMDLKAPWEREDSALLNEEINALSEVGTEVFEDILTDEGVENLRKIINEANKNECNYEAEIERLRAENEALKKELEELKAKLEKNEASEESEKTTEGGEKAEKAPEEEQTEEAKEEETTRKGIAPAEAVEGGDSLSYAYAYDAEKGVWVEISEDEVK